LALIDREESSCYYLPLTPRVSLPLPPQSAVQVSMSMFSERSPAIDDQRVKMALADVCGINPSVDFGYSREEDKIAGQIEAYTKNFTNNLQLAVPPFVNVSAQ